MIDHNRTALHKTATALNATPLSQHVLALFKQEKQSPEDGMALVALLVWAQENMQDKLDYHWMELVTGNVAQLEASDPQGLYETLEDSGPILDAETLEEAAMCLLRNLADYFPANQV